MLNFISQIIKMNIKRVDSLSYGVYLWTEVMKLVAQKLHHIVRTAIMKSAVV